MSGANAPFSDERSDKPRTAPDDCGMTTHPTIRETFDLMRFLHGKDVDKTGYPYWTHPLRVMMRLTKGSDDEKHAALLHDVIEDTGVTEMFLLRQGYSLKVIEIVQLLTRLKPKTYAESMDELIASRDKSAMRVKLADLYDNSSPRRVDLLPKEHRGIVRRLNKSIETLEMILMPSDHNDIQSGDPRPCTMMDMFYPDWPVHPVEAQRKVESALAWADKMNYLPF